MLIADPAERKAKAEAKRHTLLHFLRNETWSTTEVLTQLVGIDNRQAIHKTLTRMQDEELVKKHELPIGGRVRPVVVWGITPNGIAAAFDDNEPYEERPYFSPSRLALSRVPHQIDLQRARLSAESAGWQNWQRGERLGFNPPIRPDALVTSPDGELFAIEVERTIKTKKRYQQVIKGHLSQIQEQHWSRVLYLMPPDFPRRLKRVFDSIEHIVIADRQYMTLEDKHRKRFLFLALPDWPDLDKGL